MSYSDTGNPNEQGCQFEGDEGWVHVNRSGIWAEPESLLFVDNRQANRMLTRPMRSPWHL
ncbi:MAG: hypothetical protein A2Z25_16570 [Planctomycetes bacterium RBG_16_55_9]|nr:MAG: hypothetical protein A2Z25_16570 [Planctomycetes bacterium RBG_16_55_9]